VLLPQGSREFPGRGRLPGTLEAGQHHRRRRLRVHRELARGPAEGLHELLVHDLHELLAGRETLRQVRAERPFLHPVDERARDRDVHVGFEEGTPDPARHLVDVAFGGPPAVRDRGEDPLETVGEGVEQGESGYPPSSAAKIADANSCGSKSTRSSTPSPTPTTFTGSPSSDWIASTMP